MGRSVKSITVVNVRLVYTLGFRSSLVFEKIAGKDIRGALENLENCGEVLQRYPGLCRFTMW